MVLLSARRGFDPCGGVRRLDRGDDMQVPNSIGWATFSSHGERKFAELAHAEEFAELMRSVYGDLFIGGSRRAGDIHKDGGAWWVVEP